MKENQKESQSQKTPVDSTTEKTKTNSLTTKEVDKNGATKKDTATSQRNQGFDSNAFNSKTTTPTAKKENKANKEEEEEELEEVTSRESSLNKTKTAPWSSRDKK